DTGKARAPPVPTPRRTGGGRRSPVAIETGRWPATDCPGAAEGDRGPTGGFGRRAGIPPAPARRGRAPRRAFPPWLGHPAPTASALTATPPEARSSSRSNQSVSLAIAAGTR